MTANDNEDWSTIPLDTRVAMATECRKIFGDRAAEELLTLLKLPADLTTKH